MATPAYDDRHFQEVEADKKAALNEVDETYGNMISNSDQYFNKQIDAVEQWGDKQAEIQQDNTDFAIEKLEQQKAQAQKDYTKEQSGAYVDWQKQSGEYGANAEAMAAQGMQNTGYSESSQVSMYNTYQNRVATAREVFSRAVLEYDNAMKEARLQNNAILAEIAADTLQQKLELSLEGFQYKNSLIIEKQQAKQNIENTYYNRYLDVLDQINRENALEEEQRQFDLNLEMKNREFEEGVRQFNEELARAKEKDAQTDKPILKPDEKTNGGGAKQTARNETVGKDGSDIKGTNNKSNDKPEKAPKLGAFAQSLSHRLATDFSLNTPQKKADLLASHYKAGHITEEEGRYLMSLY